MIFSNQGLLKRVELELDKKRLEMESAKEMRIRDSILRQIKLMEQDSTEIERIARERYGMKKPGEKIFYYRNKK
ncbi:MAG: Septum formation initiator family protein [Ignavibacteria bacterium]|nr:Septum formation initiator family protein [Ignavibacteria bacterium]